MVRLTRICGIVGLNGYCRTSSRLFRATRDSPWPEATGLGGAGSEGVPVRGVMFVNKSVAAGGLNALVPRPPSLLTFLVDPVRMWWAGTHPTARVGC